VLGQKAFGSENLSHETFSEIYPPRILFVEIGCHVIQINETEQYSENYVVLCIYTIHEKLINVNYIQAIPIVQGFSLLLFLGSRSIGF
jgi:hypothetical protein